ncbi:MAG: hypothetical protein AAB858_02285 [Patescibacteria group bacterium]
MEKTMFNNFLKFFFGFTLLIVLGVSALALSSYASPYLKDIKASVFEFLNKGSSGQAPRY